MTKRRLLLHLLPALLCVRVSSGYWHTNGSFLRIASRANSEHTWITTFGQSHPLHLPYTLKCFTLSDFIPLHSRLFAQNHIHDQTWPDPIKVMPGNTSVKPSAIPQRWKQRGRRRRRSPLCSQGFWNNIEETRRDERSQASWKICEERSFCSWFGPMPQELGFTAKSLSRTDITSAG